MYNRILICTDGSKYSRKAIEHAIEMAKRFNVALSLIHIYNPGRRVIYRKAPPYNERILKRDKQLINEAGLETASILEIGHPAEEICKVADKEKFDLIILGSRGVSEVQSFFLGSVSDKVSHHAKCPVLIVR